MFEDLKRLFRNEPAFVPARDGLTGGDASLMELLDLGLLQGEARACDIAADAVGWAVAQLSLAELYISRMDMLGRDRGERAKAALALDSALDVFGDNGHWGLGALAAERLERLRVAA